MVFRFTINLIIESTFCWLILEEFVQPIATGLLYPFEFVLSISQQEWSTFCSFLLIYQQILRLTSLK